MLLAAWPWDVRLRQGMLCLQLLFRSVNKLLMDTATSEYLFCSDFFQEAAVFYELFAPTLQVVESALAATLPVCSAGALLCCAAL